MAEFPRSLIRQKTLPLLHSLLETVSLSFTFLHWLFGFSPKVGVVLSREGTLSVRV